RTQDQPAAIRSEEWPGGGVRGDRLDRFTRLAAPEEDLSGRLRSGGQPLPVLAECEVLERRMSLDSDLRQVRLLHVPHHRDPVGKRSFHSQAPFCERTILRQARRQVTTVRTETRVVQRASAPKRLRAT